MFSKPGKKTGDVTRGNHGREYTPLPPVGRPWAVPMTTWRRGGRGERGYGKVSSPARKREAIPGVASSAGGGGRGHPLASVHSHEKGDALPLGFFPVGPICNFLLREYLNVDVYDSGSPSSSGLGHQVFILVTGVQFSLEMPFQT